MVLVLALLPCNAISFAAEMTDETGYMGDEGVWHFYMPGYIGEDGQTYYPADGFWGEDGYYHYYQGGYWGNDGTIHYDEPQPAAEAETEAQQAAPAEETGTQQAVPAEEPQNTAETETAVQSEGTGITAENTSESKITSNVSDPINIVKNSQKLFPFRGNNTWPWIVAHRGNIDNENNQCLFKDAKTGYEFTNTKQSIDNAVHQGVNAIETDVRIIAERETGYFRTVIVHDRAIDVDGDGIKEKLVTNSKRRDAAWNEIAEQEAGIRDKSDSDYCWYEDLLKYYTDNGYELMDVDSLFAYMAESHPDTKLFIDLKGCFDESIHDIARNVKQYNYANNTIIYIAVGFITDENGVWDYKSTSGKTKEECIETVAYAAKEILSVAKEENINLRLCWSILRLAFGYDGDGRVTSITSSEDVDKVFEVLDMNVDIDGKEYKMSDLLSTASIAGTDFINICGIRSSFVDEMHSRGIALNVSAGEDTCVKSMYYGADILSTGDRSDISLTRMSNEPGTTPEIEEMLLKLAGDSAYADMQLIVNAEDTHALGLEGREGVDSVEYLEDGRAALISLNSSVSMQEQVIKLAQESAVTSVEPNYYVALFDSEESQEDTGANMPQGSSFSTFSSSYAKYTNDKYYQYYLARTNIKGLWDTVSANKDSISVTKLAIVDTGCNLLHEDLKNVIDKEISVDVTAYDENGNYLKLEDDVNPDPSGHGTKVASVCVAECNNGKGIAGVASCYTNDVVDAFVVGAQDEKNQKITLFNLVKAIKYALNQNPDVMNISLGLTEDPEILRNVISEARAEGCIVVSAAGNGSNEGENSIYKPIYPSDYSECFSVTALDSQNRAVMGYHYGHEIDLAAPGIGIKAAVIDGKKNYIESDGTSYSSAIVASVISLMHCICPELTFDKAYEVLSNTAIDISNGNDLDGTKGGYDYYSGYGLINATKAAYVLLHDYTYLEIKKTESGKPAESFFDYSVLGLRCPPPGRYMAEDTETNAINIFETKEGSA